MDKTRAPFLTTVLLLGLLIGPAAAAATLYSTDFESGLDSAWSLGSTQATDATLGHYNGNYSLVDGTTLTLTNLPAHTSLALRFDLYLFSTWDGENTTWGKDYFSLSGDVNGSWTFTNHQPEGQSYPGVPDEIYGTGLSATHVYRGLDPTGSGDAFVIAHNKPMFTVTFSGPTTQTDEWWGIDNVSVSNVPIPTSFWLMLAGLLFLSRAIRQRSPLSAAGC